nr:hypothetical protein [Tanacetum cinerariifolium]
MRHIDKGFGFQVENGGDDGGSGVEITLAVGGRGRGGDGGEGGGDGAAGVRLWRWGCKGDGGGGLDGGKVNGDDKGGGVRQ